jgi:SPP1 family predicted phage head-tail adaptor
MLNYKQSITNLPTYNDGKFRLFEIHQTKTTYPVEYLKDTGKDIWFEELSISDRLRFDAEERKKKITYKLRIPQTKEITSLHVVKIGKEYNKVFNAYHFTDKDGFKQTDLTLEEYPRVKLEVDL